MINEINLENMRSSILSDLSESEGARLYEKTQTLLMLSLLQNQSPEMIAHDRARSKLAYQKLGIIRNENASTEMELA